MKTRAQHMMETVLAEQDPASAPHVDDMPQDKDAAAPGGAAQPDAASPDAPSLQQVMDNMAKEPDGMADMLDAEADHMERYLDEDDKETYTAQDDKEKGDIQEAATYARKAAHHMRSMGQGAHNRSTGR